MLIAITLANTVETSLRKSILTSLVTFHKLVCSGLGMRDKGHNDASSIGAFAVTNHHAHEMPALYRRKAGSA